MEGMVIVIFLLIVLMKNQVDVMCNFSEEDGVVYFINFFLNKGVIDQVWFDIFVGKIKLLYVVFELLMKEENVEFLWLVKILFYVVDEVYCIFEWGYDFCLEYCRICLIINEIGKVFFIVLIVMVMLKVQYDIQKNLGMVDVYVFKFLFNCLNLYYEVCFKIQNVDKDIIKFIKNNLEKLGIIYCLSWKKVEEFVEIF